MWLANWVGKVPFKIRLALVISILVAMFLLAGPVIIQHTGLWLVLIFLIFFDKILAKTEHKKTYSNDILKDVIVEGEYLKVGQQRIEKDKLSRIAIGESSKRYGYLQFPFNPKFAVSYYFPAEQTERLRAYLAQQLPDVTFVE
ncbi:hypothetical protein CWE09_09085 [Aliidiomarina minuta]|uniref:Uncharacterized protein n=1 Tax=Aliidiomarina minuta TaxID=880057 RepID=A0A432WA17_9GAMM|nr:hypothetical protein [Aliidiomarina minuta]RUO26826.1 hypothetical protein CWE09_09085 [Aliidiomarina minuta]